MTEVKVALIGNPNIGKSSLFNQLTGLRQKVGNYPGVTVDKKMGVFEFERITYRLVDLPGTYSLYPNSQDEEVANRILLDPKHPDYPDKIIVVADAVNLKRSLQLFEQVLQLKIPTLLVINMVDEANKRGIQINGSIIGDYYKSEVVFTNARKGTGIGELKEKIGLVQVNEVNLFPIPTEIKNAVNEVQKKLFIESEYRAWQTLSQLDVSYLDAQSKFLLNEIKQSHHVISKRLQVKEFLHRNISIDELLKSAQNFNGKHVKTITSKIDKWVMHPILGYVIFAFILFVVFQSIFSFSQFPMTWIETGFMYLSQWVKNTMPDGPLEGLIADAIIPGIGGILIFVPQIAILFFLILILEETGYMSRVVFLMDRWMKPFGLNGKSIVPLISGAACAIPAVMAARNIEHNKEKLITILVTPFMTCSARLPVYSLIIGLIIADQEYFFFNLKGLVLLAMYALGVIGALLSGLLLKWIIKDKYKSYLAIEIPNYQAPLWKNVFISLWEKVKAFVFGAGKIILAISIVLWVLASFGPTTNTLDKDQHIDKTIMTNDEYKAAKRSYQLEHSYLGLIGNWFEPAIRPLGYDWKTGIGIFASFAAREVFVPTMATIYSISDSQNEELLSDKMRSAKDSKTGKPVFNFASGVSLLLFYAFAMMCMSTFAAVKRETKTWKWPFIQLISMSGIAYLAALLAYQILK